MNLNALDLSQIQDLPAEAIIPAALLLLLALEVLFDRASAAGLFLSRSAVKHLTTYRGVVTTILNQLDRDLAAHTGPLPPSVHAAAKTAHRKHEQLRGHLSQRNVDAALRAAFDARAAYDTAVAPTVTDRPQEATAA